jgi:hypothetical protein
MLEFNKSVPIHNKKPQGIYSPAIQSIYSLFYDKNKLDYIIPFDERPFFLSPQGHKDLYGSNFSKVSYRDIEKRFVDPFGAKTSRHPYLFKLTQGKYDSNIRNYLENNYVEDIEKHLLWVKQAIKNKEKKEKIRFALRDIWKKVTDFYILRIIFREDTSINELIIIMGNSHQDNLNKLFKTMLNPGPLTFLNEQKGKKKGNCVELYNTYMI